MKKIAVFLAAAASVLLLYVILATSLEYVATNEGIISNLYTDSTVIDDFARNRGITISYQDLIRSYLRLTDYLEGKVPSIDIEVTINGEKQLMFDYEQETVHMVEVRDLWQGAMRLRNIFLLACLVLCLVAVLMSFRNAALTVSKGYLIGFFACLLVFGFFGTWGMLDFHSFWTFFHQALFTGDDWLFDVTKSRMINMLPEEIFSGIAMRTVVIVASAALVLLALAVLCLILNARRRAFREAEEERKKLIRERREAGLPIEDELLSKQQLNARREKERAKIRAERAEKRAREREERKAAFQKARQERAERTKAEKEKKAALKAERERLRAELRERQDAAHAETAGGEGFSGQPEEDDGNEYASIDEILYRKAVEEGRIPPRDDSGDYVSSRKKKKRAGKGLFARYRRKKNARPFDLILPDDRDREDRT